MKKVVILSLVSILVFFTGTAQSLQYIFIEQYIDNVKVEQTAISNSIKIFGKSRGETTHEFERQDSIYKYQGKRRLSKLILTINNQMVVVAYKGILKNKTLVIRINSNGTNLSEEYATAYDNGGYIKQLTGNFETRRNSILFIRHQYAKVLDSIEIGAYYSELAKYHFGLKH